MIQLNLLPEIKLKYIKTKHSKRRVIVFSFLAVSISVGLLLITFSLTSLQKKHISDLNKDIANAETSLKNTDGLAKIVTIQNQLNSLPALYSKRPVSSRLFPYMQQTTSANIGISDATIDFAESTLEIKGTSDTLESVNRYADTLKFTTYKIQGSDDNTEAFSEVVLAEFERTAQAATFTIKMNFDPAIFDAANTVTLSVPQTISSRSETELPDAGVFNAAPAAEESGE